MKCRIAVATLAIVLICAPIVWAQTPQQLFQQALSMERAHGRLEEAVQLYQRVVKEAGEDRTLASRALLQLGRCYEQLGASGARAAYERLLREYADQAQVASEAKSRLAVLALDTPPVPGRSAMTVRRLPAVGPGNDLHAMSPDGSKALIGDYTKGQNLAVFDFSTRQSRLLTTFDWTQSWVAGGIWSTDGRQVAYTQAGWKSDTVAELRVASLYGEARTVFRNDGAPGGAIRPSAWLPDGKSIVAVIQRPDKTAVMGVVSVTDGKFTALHSFSWAFNWSDSPVVSPDGRFIAYVERVSGLGDVHVVSVDGRQAYRVTDHPSDDEEPVWSPDGKSLAFISKRLGGESVWTIAMDGGAPRGEPAKLKDGMTGVQLLEWSPRGIAAVQFLRSWDIYTIPMDPGAGRSTGAPQAVRYQRTGRNVSPAWSPDGKQLAFVSSSPSDPRSRYLVVMPQSGGQPREFPIPTTSYGFDQSPYDVRWFGNGQGLGFSGSDAKGEPVMFRLTLASGEWKTYPVPVKSWTRTEWNQDGTAFYYSRQSFAEPDGGIFERSVDGRERRIHALPAGGISTRGQEFSPDRQWLAFLQYALGKDGQTTSVIALNVASGEARTLASLTGEQKPGAPSLALSGWSPDGAVIIQRYPGGQASTEWFLAPLDGSAPRPLRVAIPATGGTHDAPRFQPVGKWSPDGSTMVFAQPAISTGAFILENPLAEVTRGTAARRR